MLSVVAQFVKFHHAFRAFLRSDCLLLQVLMQLRFLEKASRAEGTGEGLLSSLVGEGKPT